MASRIKGLTVEIGGDTTGLQKALQGVNGKIKNTQSQLKEVDRLLKLDPKNTELLAQKQKLLAGAISDTREKLKTMKLAAQQAEEELKKGSGKVTQEQYDGLQREIIATEQDLRKLESSAAKAGDSIEKSGDKAESSSGKFSKLAKAAGSGVAKGVETGVKAFGAYTVAAATAGTAVSKAALSSYSDFESSMSQVQATMGIAKDAMSTVDGQSVNTMDTLNALAKQMGAETSFSATQCADALNYLALAGYDTQQMCDTLPTVLNLAAAGGIDLASASDMVTDAMSALGMGVVFPAAMPYILDSLRMVLGWAWTYVTVAEMIGASSGIGYMIIQSQRMLNVGKIFVGILTIGIIGLLFDFLFKWLSKKLFPWFSKS